MKRLIGDELIITPDEAIILRQSVIGKDFFTMKYIPEIDALLDYRSKLEQRLKEEKCPFCKVEIKATDILITIKWQVEDEKEQQEKEYQYK